MVGGAILGSCLLFVVVSLLYAPMLMMRDGARNGQTLGKQFVGIRVVRDNGQPYDFGTPRCARWWSRAWRWASPRRSSRSSRGS